MKLKLSLALISSFSIASLAAACDTCKKDHVFGKPEVVGFGMAWTWVKLDKDKKPAAVGVSFTETALQGLAAELPTSGEMPMRWIETRLEMPKGIKDLPYDHVSMDWNPKGHIPPGIYDVPHFDFHFYLCTSDQRAKITASKEDLARGAKQPAQRFVPAGYILPPGTYEPGMGAHWVDPTSPELSGKPFTTTYIYGSFDGKSMFLEPMVTHAFLASKAEFQQDVKPIAAYQKSGYYPTSYRISYNADRKEYSISLEGLKYHKAAR